jgi:hypothetical protein
MDSESGIAMPDIMPWALGMSIVLRVTVGESSEASIWLGDWGRVAVLKMSLQFLPLGS